MTLAEVINTDWFLKIAHLSACNSRIDDEYRKKCRESYEFIYGKIRFKKMMKIERPLS
jgi:hypothetical protein